jgi:hypothetical protein
VGRSEKVEKYADVIYGWSLSRIITSMIDAVDQVVKIKWLISPMKKRDYGP